MRFRQGLAVTLCLLLGLTLSRDLERVEKARFCTWYLAMNLNPADGHIMDYLEGWDQDRFIGTYKEALSKDYLNRVVWSHPISYIAHVRHQAGEIDAVKVFRFIQGHKSLLYRFQNDQRQVVTEGGPLQESISAMAKNLEDDPVFSVNGDLAFNWVYTNNGVRIVLTGGHLSAADSNVENTHGLGNHISFGEHTGAREISNIHDCPHPSCTNIGGRPVQLQGTDHGVDGRVNSGPVYGNYAIYVSEDATSFPSPGQMLQLELEVEPALRFF